MKTIYFIRHAKAKNFHIGESDFEREISKKGKKQIRTIGSYMKLREISPDMILSSCALRAQQTTVELANIMDFDGDIQYLRQMYNTSTEDLIDIISIQDESIDSLFLIGHHPYMTELVNLLIDEHISKIPLMGVVAAHFDIRSWSEIENIRGKIEFFIFPKQFWYYMPKQIRAVLKRD